VALHHTRKTAAERFIESFNGRLRDELLNETLFKSLPHPRAVLEVWRHDYEKNERPLQTRLDDALELRQRPQRGGRPPMTQKAQINPRLSPRLDEKRGSRGRRHKNPPGKILHQRH
jgi:hypothetical protein